MSPCPLIDTLTGLKCGDIHCISAQQTMYELLNMLTSRLLRSLEATCTTSMLTPFSAAAGRTRRMKYTRHTTTTTTTTTTTAHSHAHHIRPQGSSVSAFSPWVPLRTDLGGAGETKPLPLFLHLIFLNISFLHIGSFSSLKRTLTSASSVGTMIDLT